MEISNSDLKFLEKTKKLMKKKTYDKEQNLAADEFDIQQSQAPLKTFNKVNREKKKDYRYRSFAHRKKIYSFLGRGKPLPFHLLLRKMGDDKSSLNNAELLDLEVNEINDYEKNKAVV
jgi:hypothetical protein